MEICVNEYVRTDMGICKITNIKGIDKEQRYCIDICFPNYDLSFINLGMIKKHSPNIIDVIDVGDYVNGYKVSFIGKDVEPFVQCDYPVKEGTTNHYLFYERAIESIVTHEQFNSIKYEVI